MSEMRAGTVAKRLAPAKKGEFVRESFQHKVAHMTKTLQVWKEQGKETDEYWPRTLAELREWNAPEAGIYSWTSPNTTSPNGRYKDLVAVYTTIRTQLNQFVGNAESIKKKVTFLTSQNQALAAQNSRLIWQIMEIRDELSRVDRNNKILKKLSFP